MKTTVHVQRDPAEHYQVVLKHRSGQPKVVTSVTCKKGRVRSRGRVFFGRGMEGRGASIILEQADQEDLRMAIDFLTQLRASLVGPTAVVAHLRYTSKDGKRVSWKNVADLAPDEVTGVLDELNDMETRMKSANAKRGKDLGSFAKYAKPTQRRAKKPTKKA